MKIKKHLGTFAAILMSVASVSSAQDRVTTKSTLGADMQTLTGCLQRGDDEYILTTDEGGIWEISPNSIKLDKYLWDIVTITGVVSAPGGHGTEADATNERTKRNVHQNATAYGHIRVTKLTVVSNTCE